MTGIDDVNYVIDVMSEYFDKGQPSRPFVTYRVRPIPGHSIFFDVLIYKDRTYSKGDFLMEFYSQMEKDGWPMDRIDFWNRIKSIHHNSKDSNSKIIEFGFFDEIKYKGVSLLSYAKILGGRA